MSKGNECVKVMIRCRPLNQKEKDRQCANIVDIKKQEGIVVIKKEKDFKFDNVFDDSVSQEEIYNKSAFGLVESVVTGYNGTIFAYGQTGCGKTHTMMGYAQSQQDKGIIPRTFDQILSIIQQTQQGVKSLVRCSFIEIYNEEIHDLLSDDVKKKYDLKQGKDSSVYIKDLNMIVVKTITEMNRWMNKGNSARSTGETLMNAESSRSHSIFTIYVEQSLTDEKGNERITLGKLNLVDLAGSERLSKTGAQGDRLKEATKINLSLSALGNVISALVDGKSKHIPYRDSKLTRLLQDSLGGNTKTIMIANISPADYNYDETYGTLRYAARAKNIQNKPTVNEDPKDALLKEFTEEIKKLKDMLQQRKNGGSGGVQVDHEQQQQQQNHAPSNQQMLAMTKSQQVIQNINLEQQQKQQEIENQLENERKEKAKLEELIKGMNSNVMEGGVGDDTQKQEYQEYKQKLEEQEKQHQLFIESRKIQEEENLAQECTFQNLQEEVEHLRKMAGQLRTKYKGEQQEVKALQKEHHRENEDINDLLRIQEKELKLFRQIAKQVFKKEEVDQLKQVSTYNELKENYSVPAFLFRDKTLRFPKLNSNQTQENDKDDLKFTNTPGTKASNKYQNHSKKNNSIDENRKNKIRDDYNDEDINFQDFQIPMKINKKVHLQPIRNSTNNMNVNSAGTGERTNHNDQSVNKNNKNAKLQPLQQLLRQQGGQPNIPVNNSRSKQMDINFKATIHINNNGDIYY